MTRGLVRRRATSGRACHAMRALLALTLIALALPGMARAELRTIQGYIPMSDGVTLAYQVVLPDPALWGDGPYPTLLDYSGYGPGRAVNYDMDDLYVSLGYALAGVNMRGSGCSGGVFDYFEPRQALDGAEAIDWLATQPWSTGRVAMIGKSYPGITQLFVAAMQPKHLVGIVPGHVFGDLYRDVPFPGGIMNEVFAGGWSLAVQPAGAAPQIPQGIAAGDQECAENQIDHAPNARWNPLVQAVEHQYDDEMFRERSPYEFVDRIEVPVLLVESWQDEQVGSRAANLAERFNPEIPWRLVASNGDHNEYWGPTVQNEVLRFLTYHLKQKIPSADDDGVMTYADALANYVAEPHVRVEWEKGSDRVPRFVSRFDAYPPTEAESVRVFLRGGGRIDTAAPVADAPTTYAYVPGVGTHNQIWSASPPQGTTASFTTPALSEDLAVVGTGSVDLWMISSAPDTDIEVMLTEVRPDGQEVYVQRGWLRASHRALDASRSTDVRPYQTHRLEDVAPLMSRQPALLRVELFPMAHVFRAGSALRITVEAPAVASGLWGFTALPLPAQNTILHTARHASSIALPAVRGLEVNRSFPDCPTLRNQPCRANPVAVPEGSLNPYAP